MRIDEPSFASLRTKMVEEQLKSREIIDTAVLKAMNTAPREVFVLPAYQDIAYEDSP